MPGLLNVFSRQSKVTQLDRQIREEGRTIDLDTAKELMEAVTEDGRISPEERSTVGQLWLDTTVGRLETTAVGEALVDGVYCGASAKTKHPRPLLWAALDMATPGFPIKASYHSSEGLEEIAMRSASQHLFRQSALMELVSKYEGAYQQPVGTGSARINPDVQARFEELAATPLEQLDQDDPMAPMRAYLDANYRRQD